MSLLVGICGGSGSGKSTLAERLRRRLGVEQTTVISFDTYYRDQSHLSPAARAALNYDHPDTLDVDLFVEHLDALATGTSVDLPIYDFATHTRVPDRTVRLHSAPVVLVEGILLFSFADIADRLHLRVFRECPANVRFSRRLLRDTTERGRTPASVEAQFAETVAPMHDHFVTPSRARAHLVFEHGERELDEIAADVTGEIHRRLGPPLGHQANRPAERAASSAAPS